ncbi:MAG: bifunctional DNA-formamidopyrimidine glycosylase/DNA-(apurinic or apyrimidinic site) lyase, partial [Pseudomonadota bacterium]|nr:bifunctional DNA-formamidopyrimidine glycosylase/DNA-(apurinic or apyrimidinic site) lyase [Pseudomonadota bacterium]
PELPEVETVMRGLRARLEGRTIVKAALNRPNLRWPLPPGLERRLTGAHVCSLSRRGKYILIRLAGGDTMLLHLGMSGRVSLRSANPDTVPLHEHLVMEMDDGWRMGFVDPRRFGSVDLVATASEQAHWLLAGLGPEPLGPEFTPGQLAAALAGKRTSIKPALLDQRIVAGLGNIYVCEALYRARLSPVRSAHTIAGNRATRLVLAIRETLAEAIAAGGSSLRDYVRPDGEGGYFQYAWSVYGRESKPCALCPGVPACHGVRRIIQAGRSTFYCGRIQR